MDDSEDIGSHRRDLERLIVSIFNAAPISAQPKYMVALAGGSQALNELRAVIEKNTLRGERWKSVPLRLVSIDLDDAGLEDAPDQHNGVDRLVLPGPGVNLEDVIAGLRRCGIDDPENALYVIDAAPADIRPAAKVSGHAVVTDILSAGAHSPERSPDWRTVFQKHGVIVLGSHAAWVKGPDRLQALPDADRFLMQMAAGGLVPELDCFYRYPKGRAAAKRTLGLFKVRDYLIRFAHEADMPTLVLLEARCWPTGLQMPEDILRRRLVLFREGQLVLEARGAVLGVVYSQRVHTTDFLGRTSSDIHHLHDPDGPIAQLLAINVLPEAQDQSHGDQLLEFMLQYCAAVAGVDTVVGITRCKDYAKHAELPMERYIALRNERGRLVDTVLRFHEQHGAIIEEAIAGYRPSDEANRGFGVLVKYDAHLRRRNEARYGDVDQLLEVTEQDVASFVVEAVRSILQGVVPDEIELAQPLFELGLDSADLLDLNERIGSRFGLVLEAAFFFEHNSCEKIISRVGELVSARVPAQDVGDVGARAGPSIGDADELEEETAEAAARRPDRNTTADKDQVAIVGVACLLPGGIGDPEQFWKLIEEGREAISRLPAWRWKWPSSIDPQGQHQGIDFGGFAQDVEKFDAAFFRISPRDAAVMDPQQRILLQLSWACLEDAGLAPQSIAGTKTGVFVGASGSDYQLRLSRLQDDIDGHFGLATSMAILANRLSYFYDLTGPSIQIDGACASSLVALHEAAQSITSGQCSQALVAGINIMSHPAISIAYYKAGMLATDGKCKTFDKAANGYVRGEGGLVMLLKPVRSAERDGNHIYGIVRGSATNHGGRAAGITVPNPARQADLIEQACRAAEVDAHSIGYVEAHGTGTSLGDPIEVRGLTEAFARLSVAGSDRDEQPYCGLGSVKTNIGHLEAAAGLAGLLKAVLCIRHRQIPASLNFDELNPHISLAGSPFFIADRRQPWNLRGRQKVRRAGVSSFGSGGTNAHVIVEEYLAPERNLRSIVDARRPALVVLSARDERGLRARVKQLVEAIDRRDLEDRNLLDIAYTLQVGREAMESRLGLIANSISSLEAKLRDFLAGSTDIEDLYLGQVKPNRETVELFGDEELKEAVAKWIVRGKHGKLLDLWVKGLSFDWQALYGQTKPQRISLPTYPFATERYWIEEGPGDRARSAEATAGDGGGTLHPLLHRNTSDLWAQRFSTRLRAEDGLLRDHVVSGVRVLPGVAHLEMARAAVEAAAGVDSPHGLRLQRVVWLRPVVVGPDGLDLHIELFEEDGGIDYQIYSEVAGGDGEERVIHSQGRAVVGSTGDAGEVDLAGLPEADIGRGVSAADCYARIDAEGVKYGPSLRAMVGLTVGSDAAGHVQVLARLELPQCVEGTSGRYVLHPSIMDAALQASVGLRTREEVATGHPLLPFALEELLIVSACPASAFAWVRLQDQGAGKLDIDVCDEAGRICVRLRGFSTRSASGELSGLGAGRKAEVVEGESELVTLTPIWEAVAGAASKVSWPAPTDRVVIIGGTPERRTELRRHYPDARQLEMAATAEQIGERLHTLGLIDHIVWLAPEQRLESVWDNAIIEGQQHGVLQCFRLIKAMLALDYGGKALGWTVITTQSQAIHRCEAIDPTHASVHGLIGSLAKEHPSWRVRLVDLPLEKDWPLGELLRLPADAQGKGWGYRDGEWYRLALLTSQLPEAKGVLYRRGGVYVVIGGAGGIGSAWSEYMIRQYEAQIVWIGRRAHDASIQGKRDRLSKLGPAPLYVEADATDRWALERACGQIRQAYGQIHGVIHSAITLSDRSLARMEEASFCAVLSAKVDVSVRLAQVFCEDQLDFVLFFSSVLSFDRPAGQGNYAAGCTFKDAFAQALGQAWSCPVKVMNWGYWGNVGIVASADYRARMLRSGLGSIEDGEGMAALETLLAAPQNQLAFVKTAGPSQAWQEFIAPGNDSHGSELLRAYGVEAPSTSAGLQHQAPPPAAGELMAGRAALCEIEELAGRLLWTQLVAAGFPASERTSLSAIKAGLGLQASYDRWLNESLRILTTCGHLRQDGEWHAPADKAAAVIDASWRQWELRKETWLTDPAIAAWVILVETTLRALPGVLSGAVRATDVMFPNGSLALVEGIYKDNPVADYFNEALAGMVVGLVEERLKQEPTARLRLLEVGAGTGGTSAAVLARLKPYGGSIVEYRYTDLSQAFLLHARETYGPEHRYLDYGIFDVEKPIAGQGIDAGGYDVVIATNVLHATRNIRRTLRNVKAALRTNGLLLLNEIVSKSLFTHVTFGLLDGWWLTEDAALRLPGSPCLSVDGWRKVLDEEGFRSIFCPTVAADLGQHVIVCESDGVVRQQSVAARPKRTKGGHPASLERAVTEGPSTLRTLSTDEEADLLDKVQASLLQAVADLIKIGVEALDLDSELSEYGFDSISFTGLAHQLNQLYGLALMPTIFFEHPTLGAFSRHLVDTHRAMLAAKLLPSAKQVVVKAKAITKTPKSHSGLPTQSVDEGELLKKVQTSLLRAVSDLIKMQVEALDLDSELSEYGFDSISFTSLAHQLNQQYGLELMPTDFFEHPTLGDFARHLVEHHRAVLVAKFASSAKPVVAGAGNTDAADPQKAHPGRARRRGSAAVRLVASETAEPAGAEVDGVAVIGMSGRFPMSEDIPALWRNLVEERDCIVEIPRGRWDWQKLYGDPFKEPNKTNIKWGGFIDGIDEFDPLFFGISPREADLMDPQQRLMMTYIWKAIEDAGYPAASLAGSRTAIFVGVGSSGYGGMLTRAGAAIEEYGVTGLLPSFGPNRMSYFLNLHGPSEAIETACSSSLIAVHRAILALSNDNCEMAIVGGVNTLLTPDMHVSLAKAGMLSIDGRCKAFSRHANGYVRAEGVGILVIKKLHAAERDGDHIYGVIRGSAENHGGRAQSLTAPNPNAQAALLKAAYNRAGIDPRTVGYIEAHGTGTELGDPIEINGLKRAFKDLFEAGGSASVRQASCGLGTVKSNIGHLEFAAGVAGLIKVILQLKHKTLVKSLHCEELNPYIRLEESPFYVVQETRPWQALRDAQGRDLPRRAGVSSFGAGGSNAHVVIEEYMPEGKAAMARSP